MLKKAVILVSGGLDSATVLAIAKSQGYECYALSFDYGQRHDSELEAASRLAKIYDVQEHKIIELGMGEFGGSALTDDEINVPTEKATGIPVTYVPARNTVFLSIALGWAEVLSAWDIFIGVNAVDYSGYPDCRQEFINAFENLANLATKAGVEEGGFKIHTPLINLSKAQIIQKGEALNVDYSETVSCYQANTKGEACGECESCRLRQQGFEKAKVQDPTRYQH
ncbi:MAG: 7-cyano-7-deazaguanine synthase [Cycloclasticus pugetii]|jgi:7-cyano-7-deazaguanine synthase|uniref:7-cyano-7-deazaguanine synthase n=2 Tax=Cycloclasticus TaxID=34067 RepID=S5TZ31_9GAMM|nr:MULTISPECIES: 7-cyano-7-deazaguanine synthase QueC [Cycloclasticus]AFT66518.1 7-cyano-7-deazaguanine synthase 1 [Cycloclasticus sp. P1]AGS40475.1 7-cyano-7-deazaguanine synthase [Cycloclasticus zancles 78-ME]ATI03908.1 7-cyano-7-deazaguanine synthase QueC [Cycloclasticus sp. PY97N]EPD14345.1 7-cyano-7-deazaguanine synthase 1 [Cycloclasticus pugetii]MBV1898777.1 7-cyano-7-deazaguanine synthase QueC [Cycloclasticus sp.]|tara:strand:- start:3831 stop:4505 length:675 start_codon:yes stop_codon:yes gene_type:complete